ncbi:MAG: multicopper oxidase domain-containing protein [Planctomycetota bacterium]|jgi:FtsP/CotA-like multicopper oxidase with cupredoxin domain
MNRRKFIQTGLSGLATVAAGGLLLDAVDGSKKSVAAEGVAFAESQGTAEGIREFNLKAEIAEIDIGANNTFKAWTYNHQSPGPEIRVKEGDLLRVVLENNLPEPTTIHWHGLPVPNAMDGVPDRSHLPMTKNIPLFLVTGLLLTAAVLKLPKPDARAAEWG